MGPRADLVVGDDGELWRVLHWDDARAMVTMERNRRWFPGRLRVVTAEEIVARGWWTLTDSGERVPLGWRRRLRLVMLGRSARLPRAKPGMVKRDFGPGERG